MIHWKGRPVNEARWEKGVTLWQLEDQINEYAWLKSTRTTTTSREGLLAPRLGDPSATRHEGATLAPCAH